jgi:hypothetical protein
MRLKPWSGGLSSPGGCYRHFKSDDELQGEPPTAAKTRRQVVAGRTRGGQLVRKRRFYHQSSESGREDAKREAEAVMRELRQ